MAAPFGSTAGSASLGGTRGSLKASGPPASRRQKRRGTASTAGKGAGLGAGGRGGPVRDARRAVCESLLRDGFIQAFTDLFYLAHRTDPKTITANAGDAREIAMTDEELALIKEILSAAELARRQGDGLGVFERYSELADHFCGSGDVKTGLYFHEKALEVAHLADDPMVEIRALRNIGRGQLTDGNPEAAVASMERRLTLASAATSGEGAGSSRELRDEIRHAQADVLEAYDARATQLVEAGDLQGGIATHLRAVTVAQDSGSRRLEGHHNLRAGELCIQLGQPEKAVPYLRTYLTVCRDLQRMGQPSDPTGLGHRALARAYEAAGRHEDAAAELKEYASTSKATADSGAESEAQSRLGQMLALRGDEAAAVPRLGSAFDLRRELLASGGCSREDVEKSRIDVGIAQGLVYADNCLRAVSEDLPGLLRWRTQRDRGSLIAQGGAADGE